MTAKVLLDSKDLFEKFPSPLVGLEPTLNMYFAKEDGDEGRYPLSDTITYFNLSPFTAKPTKFTELQTAIAAGVTQYLFIPETITLSDNLALTAPTIMLFAPGAQLSSPTGKRIDRQTFDLTFIGAAQADFVCTYNPAAENESFTYDSVGQSTFSLLNGRMRNSGAFANTPVSSNGPQIFRDASVIAGAADKAGVVIDTENGYIDNLIVITAPSSASTNILKVETANAGWLTNITLANTGSVEDPLCTIEANNMVSGLAVVGDALLTKLAIDCSCDGIYSPVGNDIELISNGSRQHLSNVTAYNIDLTGSTESTLVNSYAFNSFIPGMSSSVVSGCSGVIINTTNTGLTQLIQTVTDSTFVLNAYAGSNGTILGLGEQASAIGVAGTVSIEINGTPVTGLTAVVPTTIGSYTLATAANTFVVGDKITATFSGTTAITNQNLTLRIN